jgi:hypothetical protein
MNKLGKLHFAAVFASIPHLVGKFVELENEADAVLRHMHVSSPHLQNMLKAMLKEARLLDCLFTKVLVAADAHENPKERRIVIDQINPLGCRTDSLIRRLEVALEAPLCSTLVTEMTVVDMPEASFIGGHSGASNHVVAHNTAITNCGEWARESDRLGNCIEISSNIDVADTSHGTNDGATINPALLHVHGHDGSFVETCLSPGRVQCVLYRPDGIPLMLGPQPRDLSGKALYSLAASALGMSKDSFYLNSDGRKQQSSKATRPLSVHDVGQTVSFKTLTRYCGAGLKKSHSIQDPDKGQVRRNPMRSGRPCLGQFAMAECADHIPVYRTSVSALKELVVRANSSTQCQLHCAGIRAAAALYLEEAPEPGKGMGIRLITPVLDGQRLVLC